MSEPEEIIDLVTTHKTSGIVLSFSEETTWQVTDDGVAILGNADRPSTEARPKPQLGSVEPPLSNRSAVRRSLREVNLQQDADRAHRAQGSDCRPPPRVAVLIPCRNEAATVGSVVSGFRAALPDAAIYVYDNCSTDQTAERALEAGALVCTVPLPGKGHVVRRMFSDIDADVFVLVDGDATYDPSVAPELVRRLWQDNLDMVVCRRVPDDDDAYPAGHRFGNAALTATVRKLFGHGPDDMLSGYRALSRAYVNSFPVTSRGFEIETEMTIHALDVGLATAEITTSYCRRPAGSQSKLRTIPDGLRILKLVFRVLRDFRPLALFSALSGALLLLCVFILAFHLAGPNTPWVGADLVVLATALFVVGLVMESVGRARREMKQLVYLMSVRTGPANRIAQAASAKDLKDSLNGRPYDSTGDLEQVTG